MKFWQIKAAAEPGVGELRLYGPIGTDGGLGWLFDEVTPSQLQADLDGLGDVSQVKVFINSEGGDVFAAQAIHSMLKRHKAQIVVYVDGLAASSASIVVMAGDRVVMPRNAMLMVHNPWALSIGDASKHRQMAETLDQVRESMIAAYQGKTGMGREELLGLLEAETWMTADEAVEMGFADEIEETTPVQASMLTPDVLLVNGRAVNLERFQKKPRFWLDQRTTAYTSQAASVLNALAMFERRTLARAGSRRNAGRALSNVDRGHWQQIQDMANRVLAEFGGPETLGIQLEWERFRAIMNGGL
jgi:ATP-dependent Clp protease protease subunit